MIFINVETALKAVKIAHLIQLAMGVSTIGFYQALMLNHHQNRIEYAILVQHFVETVLTMTPKRELFANNVFLNSPN